MRSLAWSPRFWQVLPCALPFMVVTGLALTRPLGRLRNLPRALSLVQVILSEPPAQAPPRAKAKIQFILSEGPTGVPLPGRPRQAGGGPQTQMEPGSQSALEAHAAPPPTALAPARRELLVEVEMLAQLPASQLPPPAKAAPKLRAGTGWGGGIGSGSGTGTGSGSGPGVGGGYHLHTELPHGVKEVLLADLTVLNQEVPVYPRIAIASRLQGDVLATIVINEKGVPISWAIEESQDPVFNDAVLEACPSWRFAPLTVNGQKIKAAFVVLFQFRLHQTKH